ncbi:helix-turn-helix domain-containing protein [Yoonia sp. R2-816]|uniref:helix-turn-helix domain-containing protein n=1 Tax=Yoonia sp. R2-816 TaxID=3342638 RepID=UPI00372CA2AB
MTINKPAFGQVLSAVRGALGLSQMALASQLESTQRHISFLETGRSRPTPHFLTRICTQLNLSADQRSNLFAASGYANPYQVRRFDDTDVGATLDMIERRVLANWPFPALVLDASWNILRMNDAAKVFFGGLSNDDDNSASFLRQILSPDFMAIIANWEEVSPVLYFRLQAAAAESPDIAAAFSDAKSKGLFDHLPRLMIEQDRAPVYVPIQIRLPQGGIINMTSMVGHIASVQDALVAGFEVELMIPTDDASERALRAMPCK